MSDLYDVTPAPGYQPSETQLAYLKALSLGWTNGGACQQINIRPDIPYKWRRESLEFDAMVEMALDAGTDYLEDEARRRAVEGFDKPVIYQGQVLDTYKEYSDTLLLGLLKARRPDKFNPKTADISINPNMQIELTMSSELKQLVRGRQERVIEGTSVECADQK